MSAARPTPGETSEHFQAYIDRVPDGDIVRRLDEQGAQTGAFLRELGADLGWHRYADDKWSLAELVGHLIDTERMLAIRALAFARGGPCDLPGFDQDLWVSNAEHDERTLVDLSREFESLRSSHVALFGHLTPEAWVRAGQADGAPMTPRSIAWVIAGHELHHLAIVRERYLPQD